MFLLRNKLVNRFKMSWANGLLHSMRDESLIIIKNPLAVVIKDKFPKGKFHFLVISEKDIPNIFKVGYLLH